ncbi:MAG: serine/threonine protein kinase [Myxococcaceae bacterium]|nr:serine/threonine protein kinase [Myxococcaceae bacterium]
MHGFELLRKVADGSAAEAFLARAPGAKHSVLVEVSRAEVVKDMELYGRFLDRAMGRRQFQHPHLVQRHTAGCGPDGRVYVATEAIAGPTIADRLASAGAYDPHEAVRLLIPICAALEYLHCRTVVHGNLCPKNIYLTGSPTQPVPKLLEMGLLLFRTNMSFKVPSKLVAEPYLSPERVAGHRADVRSDVYGLGVLLFELLTGRPPYAIRSLHQTAPVPVLPPAAAPLAEIVGRCLAKDPTSRYQSAREVQLALEELHLERDVLQTLDIQVALDEAPNQPPIIVGHTVNERGPFAPDARKVIVGSYEVLRPLGEGGMGRVFLARHLKLDRLVALKTLKAVYASDPLHLQRFVQEARAVNRVKHPHLVEIYDFLEEGPGRVCCVMEPLFGETLKDRAKKAPLQITRAVKIVRQACGALSAVHQAGVIHRDLKPDNLFLVDRDGEADFVKVLDFGIAQVLDDAESLLTTRAGEVVGTPAYMAPEQTMAGPLDGRADIYALGTVLYVLLQGRFPHDATQPEELLAQKVTRKPRPVGVASASGETIPQGLREIVDRCLQRNPKARFQTMDELSRALELYETDPTLLPAPAAKGIRPLWKAVAASAGALALCAAGWVWSLETAPAPVASAEITRPAAAVAPVVAEPPPATVTPEISLLEIHTTQPEPAARPVAKKPAAEKKPVKKKRPARAK